MRALTEYLKLVETEAHNTPRALRLRARLEAKLGASHPDLALADARIEQIPRLRAHWRNTAE